MTKYKKYAKYKDSGIEWLGIIPVEWNVGGFTKYISSIVDYRGKTPTKVDEGVFLVTAKNIKNGKIDYSLSQEYVKTKEYNEIMRRGLPNVGDVVFTTEAPLGEVANIDRTDIALAQRIIKFQGKVNELDNYYLKYWMMSSMFQQNLQSYGTGSTATGIKSSKLSQLIALLPSFKEQQQIASFLEQKTSEIDLLIADKERLIILLEEKRQTIITEVVTKGLSPNIKMKDSGVEWIGEIPEYWEINRLKNVSSVQVSNVDKKSVEGEETVFLCNYTDVYYNDKITRNMEFMKATAKKEQIKAFVLKKDDVIITKDSETPDDIGRASWVQEDLEEVLCGYHLAQIRPGSFMNGRYLYYLHESRKIREQYCSNANGVTRFGLSKDSIKNALIIVPPIEEQDKIANFLDNKISLIDSTKIDIRLQIEKLKEYRKSLISEAVTGKIDVRDYCKEA